MLTLIHIITVIGTILLVLYSDEQALLWILGKKSVLDTSRITFLHRAVSAGLALLLITGGLLYLRDVSFYLSDSTFIIKMTAITALILNTYFIERFSHVAVSRSFASLGNSERLPLFISGGVSALGWLTAIVCGLLR